MSSPSQSATVPGSVAPLAADMSAAWKVYRALGSPRFICAPMVRQSELPFRMLVRRHGVDLAYSPMITPSEFLSSDPQVASACFATHEHDRPLVVQLCGNTSELILPVAKALQDRCDAIDLNLGCPQQRAKRNLFGAWLLDYPDKVCEIVRTLRRELRIPVFCKIRILPTEAETVALCHKLQDAGCQLLTVHGRRRERKHHHGPADWDHIRAVKRAMSIPVIANGNVHSMEDVRECLRVTECDGVMVATELLVNPTLFSETKKEPIELVDEYLDICLKYPPPSMACVANHIVKLLPGFRKHVALFDLLNHKDMKKITQFIDLVTVFRHKEGLPGAVDADERPLRSLGAIKKDSWTAERLARAAKLRAERESKSVQSKNSGLSKRRKVSKPSETKQPDS